MRAHCCLLLIISASASAAAQSAPASGAASFAAQLDQLLGVPAGLTADAAAERALATSFDLEARRETVEAAEDQVTQAAVGYVPRINLTARALRLSAITPPLFGPLVIAPDSPVGPVSPGALLINTPASFAALRNQTAAEVGMVIPISDYLLRIVQAHSAARHSAAGASLLLRAGRRQVATAGRLAFYNWVRARLQLVVADAAVAQSKAHLTDVARLREVGRVPQADALRVEAQLAAAELLRARALEARAVQPQRLQTLVHAAGSQEPAIGEDVRGPLAPLPDALESDRWVDRANNQRPELQALAATTASLGEQAKTLRAGIYPRLEGVASATTANPNPRFFPPQDRYDTTWALGLQLGWSPTEAWASGAARSALEAQARRAAADEKQARDALRDEVVSAVEALRSAEVAVESSVRGLRSAEESYRQRSELYRNGRATSVELTDAETALTQARLDSIDALVDRRIARARLLQAAGEPVEGPLNARDGKP
jgi:outer membrane protein TolC